MMELKTTKPFQDVLQKIAAEMNLEKADEKQFSIPDTEIKLYLIRAETERAKELNQIPGAFLGSSIVHEGETFLVFRTTKPSQN